MKKGLLTLALLITCSFYANAQFGGLKVNSKHIQAATKMVDALTLTDEQMAAYSQEYMDWMDKNNPVCGVKDKDKGRKAVADRLAKIVATIPAIEGVKVDIKAYYVVEVNAFACPNGSIRIFAGLMELMTDDEILGVIGHEIGHVANKDSKEAFKKALLTSALKDAVASTSDKVAALTDSQLGELGEALTKAQYSQKAEYAADNYGYDVLANCGKDSQAMASGLRVIQGLQDAAASDKVNQLFSSHPESGKRAKKLDERYKKENKK